MATGALRRHIPKVGAECGNAARSDLCGGRSAMGVPTAIICSASVKYFFFEHLAEFKKKAQIIILDNTDPPSNIQAFAEPQLFSGPTVVSDQRAGFFP